MSWWKISLFVAAIVVFVQLTTAGSYLHRSFWAPKEEQLRMNVHKQSQIYIDGQIRQIRRALIARRQSNDEDVRRALCQEAVRLRDELGERTLNRTSPQLAGEVDALGQCL